MADDDDLITYPNPGSPEGLAWRRKLNTTAAWATLSFKNGGGAVDICLNPDKFDKEEAKASVALVAKIINANEGHVTGLVRESVPGGALDTATIRFGIFSGSELLGVVINVNVIDFDPPDDD